VSVPVVPTIGTGLRQALTVARLELGRRFAGRRALPVWGLALAPVVLFTIYAFSPRPDETIDLAETVVAFAAIYQMFILRVVIYFGCVLAFANLFRSEIIDRTLHYYLMAPIPRWALGLGKYLAGVGATVLLFELATVLPFLLILRPLPNGSVNEYLATGGWWHLATYAGITALACVGYGALFTALGLFFRNPIIPVMVVLGWEGANFILPPILKRISIVHYLSTLSPVPVPSSPFTVPAEPVPEVLIVPSLLCVSAVCLVLAARRLQAMDLPYGTT
jgi:ABC-type transport system involved in multi-copper enzyme maturation permease subunit